MAHLESTSANLDETIAKINKTVAEGKVDRAINETLGILSDARKLIGQAKNEIDALKLREKADRTDTILGDIDKKTKSITSDLQDTSENLRMTSENLQKLSDSLNKKSVESDFLQNRLRRENPWNNERNQAMGHLLSKPQCFRKRWQSVMFYSVCFIFFIIAGCATAANHNTKWKVIC